MVRTGNGTQKTFYDDPSVLYISIHRYDDTQFYPNSDDGANWRCGVGAGTGMNVNVGWEGGVKGDSDYIYAFQRIIIPICQEFAPELIFGASDISSLEVGLLIAELTGGFLSFVNQSLLASTPQEAILSAGTMSRRKRTATCYT